MLKIKNKKGLGAFTPLNSAKGNLTGFTIIELLVVIAIIGLLGSIVLVSIRSSTDKAKIAKVLQYSASLHHLLGADIVGEWNFEDNFNDTSGNNNHGTGFGPTFVINDASSQLGKAGSFDGVDDYVEVPNSPSLNITGAITIEYWVRYIGGGEFGIAKTWNKWRFYGNPLNIYNRRNGVNSTWNTGWSYTTNIWYHIVWTNTGTSESLYVNGVLTNSRNVTGTLDSSGILYIGAMPGLNLFKGLIDEVRIYSQALSSAQIQKLYAEGLEKHQNLTIK